MPNHVITPKAFAVILLASVGSDIAALMVSLPEHLLAGQELILFHF